MWSRLSETRIRVFATANLRSERLVHMGSAKCNHRIAELAESLGAMGQERVMLELVTSLERNLARR